MCNEIDICNLHKKINIIYNVSIIAQKFFDKNQSIEHDDDDM
jgi:hypothetical protein